MGWGGGGINRSNSPVVSASDRMPQQHLRLWQSQRRARRADGSRIGVAAGCREPQWPPRRVAAAGERGGAAAERRGARALPRRASWGRRGGLVVFSFLPCVASMIVGVGVADVPPITL